MQYYRRQLSRKAIGNQDTESQEYWEKILEPESWVQKQESDTRTV
jgi:hypothetical protein